ncbi:exosortase/archaeosortase family protein [Oleiharenicola lentus]|uniref:exosortase/archaeosortase family protein n=1 Tax=Oleiharenicola lentus TaxID=2508720 RepID=UPI003F673BF1
MTSSAARPASGSVFVVWFFAVAVVAALLMPLMKAWGMATDLGHGWGAPLLIAYLYWERWDERPTVAVNARASAIWWTSAATILCLLVPLRLWVTPFPLWPALVLIYVGCVASLVMAGAYLVGGLRGVRWIGGPLLILAGTIPWPQQIDQGIIQPLRGGLAEIAAELINLTGHPAIASGTTVRFGAGWVGVDEACGGIRSLQASVMMALFFGEWLRLKWQRRIALVVVGIGAALAGNFLRILFLAWRATAGEEAVQNAHDLAGWLALGLSLVLVGVCAWRWSKTHAVEKVTLSQRVVSPIANSVARWCVVVTAGLLLIELTNFIWYQRGSAARSDVPQWTIRLPSAHRTFKDVPLPDVSRDILRPDFYAAGTWTQLRDREAGAYYVEWRRGQTARFVPVLHNPAVCLPYVGCELVEALGEIRVPWSGGEIPFQTFLFRRGSERFVVAFVVWDPLRGQPLTRPAIQSRLDWLKMQWSDVTEARKDQPGQMVAVLLTGSTNTVELKALIQDLVTPVP